MKRDTQTKKLNIPVSVPFGTNLLLKEVLQQINSNEEINTLWRITNVMAVDRLGMTDHGRLHFSIVANNSLAIQRLLEKGDVTMSVVKDFQLSLDYAEVIVLLASLLHDTGMSIHRVGHEEYSLFLVNTMLREILTDFPVVEKTIVISEVLHAITSHRSDGKPLTIEAGIVRIADALDMSKGRTRLEYKESEINIHSVSALAIDSIEIKKGKNRPVQIDITMNHTAGLFQIDELLQKKVLGSGIERYLEIEVFMDKGEGKELFKTFYKRG